MIPTVGFNMRKITKGNVTMKLWDIGGQPRFRSMWERYCRGVNSIVYDPQPPPLPLTCFIYVSSSLLYYKSRFVVDSADHEKFEAARTELKNLLDKPQLAGIPILILGNKNDVQGSATVEDVIEAL